jgi:hypothetical protein
MVSALTKIDNRISNLGKNIIRQNSKKILLFFYSNMASDYNWNSSSPLFVLIFITLLFCLFLLKNNKFY